MLLFIEFSSRLIASNSHKSNFHCSEWEDCAKCPLHADHQAKSYLRHHALTMHASLWCVALVSAIVQRRRRLALEFVCLRPIRHEHRLLHRIHVLWQAQSRCSHPVHQRQNNKIIFIKYFSFRNRNFNIFSHFSSSDFYHGNFLLPLACKSKRNNIKKRKSILTEFH